MSMATCLKAAGLSAATIPFWTEFKMSFVM